MIGWMYRMVWESIWIFSFMVPVLWMWQTVFAGKYTPKTHRIGLWLFAFYVAGLVAVTGVFRLLFIKPVFAPYFNFELFIDIFACPMQYLLNFFLFVRLSGAPAVETVSGGKICTALWLWHIVCH